MIKLNNDNTIKTIPKYVIIIPTKISDKKNLQILSDKVTYKNK